MAIIPKGGGGKPEEEKTVTAGTSVIEVLPSSGKTMKKVTVNPTPSQSKTVTPSTSQQTVSPDSGKLLSKVIVKAMEDVTPEVTAQTPIIAEMAEEFGVEITTPSGSNKQILQGNNSNLQSIRTNAKKSGLYVWKYKEGKVKDELPSGYTRIGHIVSNGNQWIDTGVIPNSSNFSIKSLIRSNAETSAENWFVTIGHDKTSGAATFLQFGTNASLFAVHLTGVSVGGNTAANNIDVEIDFSVSGNTASLSGDATYTVTNASFGSGNYRSKSICICDGRWRTYGVQITVGGTLVRNLVPAKNASGVVGLYDTVGNTFYTSSGTGQFAEGNDPFWTLVGYVVDDNKSSYPDGGTQDGYWYEKVVEGIPLSQLGFTKFAIDTVKYTSRTPCKNYPINHSLGEKPKIAILLPDITGYASGVSNNDVIGFAALKGYDGNIMESDCYIAYCYSSSVRGVTTTAIFTESTAQISESSTYYFGKNITYTLLTMA